MDKLNSVLKYIKEGIREELGSIKKLKGEKLDKFTDLLNITFDYTLYYNDYNMIITEPELHNVLFPYFKKEALILRVEIPEHNANIWVYQYFNDQLFESYLTDEKLY